MERQGNDYQEIRADTDTRRYFISWLAEGVLSKINAIIILKKMLAEGWVVRISIGEGDRSVSEMETEVRLGKPGQPDCVIKVPKDWTNFLNFGEHEEKSNDAQPEALSPRPAAKNRRNYWEAE
jgi:hypothetical protein